MTLQTISRYIIIAGLIALGSPTTMAQTQLSSRYIKNTDSDNVIVFVHGVFGDSKATWTNGTVYWPDLITQDHDFSSADIFVYEYPTSIGARFSIDELADDMHLRLLSNRVENYKNIIFISHSMGGLVTRAFILKHREIVPKLRFLYFLSTPTTGSQIASYTRLIFSNPQLEKMELNVATEYLGDQVRQWLAAHLNVPTYCAYEKQLTYGLEVVSFESSSALCNTIFPIDSDHINIAKPINAEASSHLVLKSAFSQTSNHANSSEIANSSENKARIDVCPGPDPQFIMDQHFRFSYESWMRPPNPGGELYTFGRCVMTLNNETMGIDWGLAGLNSFVAPSLPALVQYGFPSNRSKWLFGDLRYGARDPFDHAKKVNVKLNEDEQQENIGSGIKKISYSLASQPREEAVSKAHLIVEDSTGKPNFDITAEIKSIPHIRSPSKNNDSGHSSSVYIYQYELNVRAVPLSPDDAQDLENLRLRPTSQILVDLLKSKGYLNGEIPISRTEHKVEVASSGFGFESEAAISNVNILLGSKIVGSFPMSFYQPRNSFTTPETDKIAEPRQLQKRKLSERDRSFANQAVMGGMAEVELGQLAQQNAQNDDVKQFGSRMVQDHTYANQQLTSLLASKNATVPQQLDASYKETYDRLSKMRNAEFDRAYMRDMVLNHEGYVKKFRQQAEHGDDPDLKSFAQHTLPVLEQHLKMAQDTSKSLTAVGSSGQGPWQEHNNRR